MKSKANIKGHAIHPMLVGFPIAFFTGTLIADLAHLVTMNAFYGQVGKYLEEAGIVFGVLAAIPGIIDYVYTVPPKSTANKRAGKHGLINTFMICLFLTALLIRQRVEVHFILVVVLELLGVILLCVAGWMGGTLVGRNQIGIDHRYAGAGKWIEENASVRNSIVELHALNKLKLNQMKLVHVNNQRIVIARIESGIVAFDDRCTHRGASLADGSLACGTVQCPWHGSQFNTATGNVSAGPAKESLKTYSVTQSGDKYYLRI